MRRIPIILDVILFTAIAGSIALAIGAAQALSLAWWWSIILWVPALFVMRTIARLVARPFIRQPAPAFPHRMTPGAPAFSAPGEMHYWIAYEGDDSGHQIRVYGDDHPASAERLRMLLASAAQHQNGRVSAVFYASDEPEALRMAPYQF
jgi:hypothetical protein